MSLETLARTLTTQVFSESPPPSLLLATHIHLDIWQVRSLFHYPSSAFLDIAAPHFNAALPPELKHHRLISSETDEPRYSDYETFSCDSAAVYRPPSHLKPSCSRLRYRLLKGRSADAVLHTPSRSFIVPSGAAERILGSFRRREPERCQKGMLAHPRGNLHSMSLLFKQALQQGCGYVKHISHGRCQRFNTSTDHKARPFLLSFLLYLLARLVC